MSRLTELIRQAKQKDPALGAELEREYRTLSGRRAFGLNFERHRPEAVELPGRPVRRGDKVRVLPPRGLAERGDQRLWRVIRIEKVAGERLAHIEAFGVDDQEPMAAAADDLVVVAEFRDPIHPGLVSTGGVHRGGDKPAHTVINGENFHVLKALTYTHRGKVDAIYIDPPYNTGDRDWKYNNDYVEKDDDYRHSKWLAFMERRLLLAKDLLNPNHSALVVTIDEKEYLRLGLLLEQHFPEGYIEMVTSIISAKGAFRRGHFSRVEEHLFFVSIGSMGMTPWITNMLPTYSENPGEANSTDPPEAPEDFPPEPIEWLGLRRREPTSHRGTRPNQFYPIFIDETDGTIHSIGDPVADDVDRTTVASPDRTRAVWPLKPDGTEMLWGLTPDVLRRNLADGFVRVSKRGTVQYLPGGTIDRIRSGEITVTGNAPDGSVEGHEALDAEGSAAPKRVWHMQSHNAETGGTKVRSALIPGRRFPFPKSLYAVEDSLRFLVGDNPSAIVLDFFAGSGTTAHAVMRLNKQDGGRRQCISVTNNEVSADEQRRLRLAGLRPGDSDWEALGICDHITKPRIEAAITGRTPDGDPIKGDYRFTDEFPMADGFEENAEFFTLTYENPVAIGHNRAFGRVAALLWLRAGATGRRIDTVPATGWDVADAYGILWDLDQADAFAQEIEKAERVDLAYVVTDDDRRFQSVTRQLPDGVEVVRLYESFLSNFRFTGVEP